MITVYAVVIFLFHFCSEFSYALDSLTSAHFLKDPETLISKNNNFTFGFFSPPNSSFRYVGVWYNQPASAMEVVWVANKNNPLKDDSGILKLSTNGNLQVSNSKNETLWSSNVTNSNSGFSVAQILDSGNLVVEGFASNRSGENGTSLWMSFQHPTDSVLPNMRFSLTKNSDLRKVLQSWSSSSEPSNGRFALGTNSLFGLFQIIIWEGDNMYWRSGPWNGNIFIGTRYHNTGYGNIFVNTGTFTQEDAGGGVLSLVFTGANASFLSHYQLSYQGRVEQRWWDVSKKNWAVSWNAPDDQCDIYGTCGEFGSCNPQTSPICSCLRGFEPKDKEEWKRGNWTGGCIRRKQRQCSIQGNTEGFLRLQMMKVPDNAEWTLGLNREQCGDKCLTNCSCLAYAYDTALACMTWTANLTDIAVLAPGGTDLYIRLAHSELGSSNKLKVIIIVSTVLGILGLLVVATVIWFLCKQRARPKSKELFNRNKMFENQQGRNIGDKSEVMIDDLQVMKFDDIVKATNNFHQSNLLGRGGFGQVHKGTMDDGQEIAVKRLSRLSGQGQEEFMNEVILISKLQHRNLVKLWGCCVEGEEKMLIYEYMPNKSLDAYLFDSEKSKLLHWLKRFSIIEGICRGLLYLHRDSRLKIIHRDLKPSNILLDENLNPKISDFGMARIFGGSQDHCSTQRVVGTYGYMSPEYAMEGHFSEKSDVFSFGVLLLEIVTGKRNSSFWFQEESLSLLGYIWKQWNEENISSLIDPTIYTSDLQEELIRCIHVGLLCVQEFAKDRPSTPTVISMLVSEIIDLPYPKPPGFIQRQTSNESNDQGSSTNEQTSSINDVTVTGLTPR